MTKVKKWIKRCIRIGYRIIFGASQTEIFPKADLLDPQWADRFERKEALLREASISQLVSSTQLESFDDANIKQLYQHMFPEDLTLSRMDQRRAAAVAAVLCAGAVGDLQTSHEEIGRVSKGLCKESEQSLKPGSDHQRDASS